MNTAEDLLNILEISKQGGKRSASKQADTFLLHVQIFAIYQNEVIDLIKDKVTKTQPNEEQEEPQTRIEIKLLTEFRSLYRTAMNNLIHIAQTQDNMIDHIHLFVRFSVLR